MIAYSTSLFIFRRDLRLHDNSALQQAMRLSTQVIPCFIFDPRQIEPHPYQSKPGLQFMLQSINDLAQQLQSVGGKLALYQARPEQVVKQLVEQQHIQAVFINRDYTPFSRRRDEALAVVCKQMGIALHTLPDSLLNEPELAVKNDKTPYKVFTAFYNHARQFPVALPQALVTRNFLAAASEFTLDQLGLSPTERPINGGRHQALALLDQLGDCADYQNTRDFPALDSTSKLSVHLKFGTCSVREAYYAITEQLGSEHPLLRQLYWRDFFTHIAYHFPQVFGRAFLDKFANLHWDNNRDYFQAWCEGKTGFPIVDAGMRELNATGCDAQPYFRIFNPWLQQLKFDQDCRYIYRWLPELHAFPPKIIHQWDKKHSVCSYPAPIIDHARESQLTKAWFKASIIT